MKRSLVAAVAIFAIFVGGCHLRPPPPPPPPCATQSAYEATIAGLINQERAARGLRQLAWNSDLSCTAQAWSDYLGINGVFYHRDLTPLLNRWNTVGEAIGRGLPTMTPAEMVAAWMASPPHADVILGSSWWAVGVGVTSYNGFLTVVTDFGG